MVVHVQKGRHDVPQSNPVEAAERARMLSVQRYDIALDLTHGDKEFGSITMVKFTVKEPGDTFIDLRAARVREVILDGNDITEGAITLDEKGYDPTHGVALRDLTDLASTLSASLQTASTRAPARDCTALLTRLTGRPTCTPSLKPLTPSACLPALTSRI